jgi:hypothetical protein
MNTIIQFLRDNKLEQESKEQVDVSTKEITSINQLFDKQCIAKNSHWRLRPKIQQNQIWSVKNEYIDFLGNTQTTAHPFLVLILTAIDDFADEEFVRVAVVSPFVEMATSNDEVCKDSSIIGFPFLIEAWNEQPVLTEILDEYFGYYEVNQHFVDEDTLNLVQKDFKEIEISRAKYLNHSITALISYVESNQNQEFGAVISLLGKVPLYLHYPNEKRTESEFAVNEPSVEYGMAAKTGIIPKEKYIIYHDENLPFEMQIKKADSNFIVTVFFTELIELFDSNDKKISGMFNEGKTVFSPIKKGLYTLVYKDIQEPIKIRLK